MSDCKELQEELEELSLHLLSMLEVALLYAGARKDKIEKVTKAYMENFEEALKDDDSEVMDREDIITVIEYIKGKYPELFNK